MGVNIPRMVIAGLSGDAGKTVVSLSLLAALRKKGVKVIPFKKGPDYIDAAWLGSVAGRTCRNLDTWLVDADDVRNIFTTASTGAELALIEGNRGLFDGKDILGSHSSAGLAKLLRAPLILVVDATKTTRTAAAMVKGCQVFDPELDIAGVILNKIAGKRHHDIVAGAINRYCSVPILGSIPKLGDAARIIPGRHLGLVPPTEYMADHDFSDKLVSIAEDHIDTDLLLQIAARAEKLEKSPSYHHKESEKRIRIGYFRDPVFTFYYPENLEALENGGARLIAINSLSDRELPPVDALYIGGGFPETHAERLSENHALRDAVRKAAVDGLPIYAECGGLIYLCRSLTWKEVSFPMAGVFPIDLTMHQRPAGHGYTLVEADQPNPYFPIGTVIKGHEFHYSSPSVDTAKYASCLRVKTGVGLGSGRDGLIYKKVLAVYTHLHAAGVKDWAGAILANARQHGDLRASANPGSPMNSTAADVDTARRQESRCLFRLID